MNSHTVESGITFGVALYESGTVDWARGALDLAKSFLSATPSEDVQELHLTASIRATVGGNSLFLGFFCRAPWASEEGPGRVLRGRFL